MFRKVCIFSGNANPALAQEIVAFLEIPLGQIRISRFSDGETFCEVQENVRGVDCYLIQPTSAPVNENFMELLIIADALRRSSVGSITAVVPYYGYARQDRKVQSRTPITSKLCADLLVSAGVNRMLCVDLHAAQIQGFFNIPFDHMSSRLVMLDKYLRPNFDSSAVLVSPDTGGVERTRAFAEKLGASLAIIDKRRERPNVSEVVNIVGEVEGKDCIIIDDMIDTAGTLCNSARALKKAGARKVVACATHAVLSGPAVARIIDSPLSEVVVTNTIALSAEAAGCDKIRVVSIGGLLGEAIRRIHNSDSISSLFV